jgi:hypothetical protein
MILALAACCRAPRANCERPAEPRAENGIDFITSFRNVGQSMKKCLPFWFVLVLAVATVGCGVFGRSGKAAKTNTPAIVTPDHSLEATVVAVNPIGRFVVLSFSGQQMPKLGQPCFIYRLGLKVAEVKITGPQQDNNIVADLLSGDAQVGDTVRDE